MHCRRSFIVLVSNVVVAFGLGAQSAATVTAGARRAFTPNDWYRVVQVASPVMTRDGEYIAVQATRVNQLENRRVSEIWVVSTDGGEPVRFSAPGMHSTAPRFSPDGKSG
jgi:hypothetical protein